MDIDKVRALTDAELVTEFSAAKRNLYDLRFQLATRHAGEKTPPPPAGVARAPARGDRSPPRAGRDGGRAMNGATMTTTKRKTKVGRVVSDKMDKTIVGSVARPARHRR